MAVSYGLIAAVVLCGGIGYLLDRTLHTSPWLAISGLVLGLMVGFYTLHKLMRRT
jgi:F0F1-type ATP synthase assembly protein I